MLGLTRTQPMNQDQLYKDFVRNTVQVHLDLVRRVQQHVKAKVYVFDATGYFNDIPYQTYDKIRYQMREQKIAMLNFAAQNICDSIEQFQFLFDDPIFESDSIGVFVRYDQ